MAEVAPQVAHLSKLITLGTPSGCLLFVSTVLRDTTRGWAGPTLKGTFGNANTERHQQTLKTRVTEKV